MYIRWIPSQDKGVVFLSTKTIQDFKIRCEKVTLHIGAWKKKLSVKPHQALNENTIGLPNNLADSYPISGNVSYDMYLSDEDLHLGPVIAFFVGEGWLSPKRRGKWKAYCRNYSQIRGLVYFCTASGVDIRTQTIRGFYFNPNAGKAGLLKAGKFPFPGAVFRRTRIDPNILIALYKQGSKIFNSHIFDKWEMWSVLSKAGFTHTPYTVGLNGLYSLNKMLALYNSVYLKPLIGRFGNGIQKIEKIPEGYLFKEKSRLEQRAKDLTQVFRLINKYKKNGPYIIQQAVPLNFQEKPVDFRVILQKDRSQKWTCSGILAKIGVQGQICTNIATALYLGREALQMIFGLSPEQALAKENEIIRICTEACLILDRTYGHFGDVGIDVLVDDNLKIWVLEINKSHQHDMVRLMEEEDPGIYHRVVTRPLEFAKALAGF